MGKQSCDWMGAPYFCSHSRAQRNPGGIGPQLLRLQDADGSKEQPPVQTKIPRILHYIFLSGFDAYIAETQRPRAKMFRWHYDSCLKVHKHWEIKFWTQEMAEDLIRQHFNWFMPIWETYDMEVSHKI